MVTPIWRTRCLDMRAIHRRKVEVLCKTVFLSYEESVDVVRSLHRGISRCFLIVLGLSLWRGAKQSIAHVVS